MSRNNDDTAERFAAVIREALCEALESEDSQIVALRYTGRHETSHVWYGSVRRSGAHGADGYWIVLSTWQLASIISAERADGTRIQTPADAVQFVRAHPATQDALKQLFFDQGDQSGPTLSA